MNPVLKSADQTGRLISLERGLPFDEKIIKMLPIRSVDCVRKIDSYSNVNFLINSKFVLRIPTANSNELSNRQDEYQNIHLAFENGFTALRIVYYDISSGIMLTSFLENYQFLTIEHFKNKNTLAKAAATLSRLHNSAIAFNNTYDPRDLFFFYKKRLEKTYNPYYENLRSIIEKLAIDLVKFKFTEANLRPCHNDPNPSNFTLDCDTNCQLVDWEYSGLCDPAWDLTFLSEILLLDNADFLYQSYGSISSEFRYRCEFLKPLVHARSVLFACEQLQIESPKLPKEILLNIYRERMDSMISTFHSESFAIAKLHIFEAI